MQKYIIDYQDENYELIERSECYANSTEEAVFKFFIKRKGCEVIKCYPDGIQGFFFAPYVPLNIIPTKPMDGGPKIKIVYPDFKYEET